MSLVANFEQIANSNPEGHNQYTGGLSAVSQEAKSFVETAGSGRQPLKEGSRVDKSALMGRKPVEIPTKEFIQHVNEHLAAKNLNLQPASGSSTVMSSRGGGKLGKASGYVVVSTSVSPAANYETLTRNYSAPKSRKEMLDGREYLVVPMTMIVPGVLNGSKGALFYPPEEVGKDPTPWNGMPITWYHPTKNGMNVSARDPEVLQNQGVGFLARSSSNGKLKAEAWLDVKKIESKYQDRGGIEVLNKLRRGEPVEISTGLFTDNTEQAGEHNGKRYTHVARNYRPDHLAILPDQRGACSVDDGCGLMMNSNPEGHNQYTLKRVGDGIGTKPNGKPHDVFHIMHGDVHVGTVKSYSGSKDTKAKGSRLVSSRKTVVKYSSLPLHGVPGEYIKTDHHSHKDSAVERVTMAHQRFGQSTANQKQEVTDNDWAEWNAKNRGKGGSKPTKTKSTSPMASRSDNAGKLAERAAQLEAKHKADGATARSSAAAIVKDRMAQVKAFSGGNNGHAKQVFREAQRAAIGYSRTRAKQHMELAKAHAAAGNHAKAAHFQARADFHKAHIGKLKSAKMTHNAELMPTGEREFVMNRLALNSNPEGHNQYSGGLGRKETVVKAGVARRRLMKELHGDYGSSAPSDLKHEIKKVLKKGGPTAAAQRLRRRIGLSDEQFQRVAQHLEQYKPVHNQEPSMLTSNQRSEIIEALIENSCGCWKAGDEMILSQFSDERLRGIAENNEEVVNALPYIKKKPKDDEEDAEDDESAEGEASVKNKPVTKNQEGEIMPDDKIKLTRDEIWNMLDPADREAITNAHDIVTKAKAELVTKLTANVKDDATKTRLVTNLGTKSLDELRDMESLIPAPVQNKAPVLRPVFGPTGNAYTTDPVSNDDQDVAEMTSPRIDWAELAKNNDSRKRQYANAN